MGHLPKIVTGEVVYYILTGTPRAPQKCYWSGLRVEFSGENHLFLICGKMPNQTLWITKYLELGLNSLFFFGFTQIHNNCKNPILFLFHVFGPLPIPCVNIVNNQANNHSKLFQFSALQSDRRLILQVLLIIIEAFVKLW